MKDYDNPSITQLSHTIFEIQLPRFEGMLYQLLKDMDDDLVREGAVSDWDICNYLFARNRYKCVTKKHLSMSKCQEASEYNFLKEVVSAALDSLYTKGLINRSSDENNVVWNSITELKLDVET
ncbi:MAG: hypothetical protein F4118_00370 [Acidimicrobiaceae bacterium]|nr:hypothetical protein [Candidatus Poribacteria bacterium]MYI34876.1 hypothetical protein [Acidimicrobiaceae bacterium]